MLGSCLKIGNDRFLAHPLHFGVHDHIVSPHSMRYRLHLCSSMAGNTRRQYLESALQPLCDQTSPLSVFPSNTDRVPIFIFELQITVTFVSYSVTYILTTAVGIVASYGLDGAGSNPGRGKIFFFTPQHPYRIWGPPSLLSIGYDGYFPGDKMTGAWSWPHNSVYC
jgi:hypothetical protein